MKPSRALAAIALAASLALCALPSRAAEIAVRVIEVNGHGEARAAPDIAYLGLEIETHAATAEECSAKNAALAQKVVKVLKDKLGGQGVVLTGDYSLSPEYNQPGPRQKPAIVGYTAQNAITVQTAEMSKIGTLIDSAIAAGANRISYLNFGLREETQAREQAITAASKDAQAQAQTLAASLGVKLKAIVKATTVPQRVPIVPARGGMMMAQAAERAPTPIEATQITVSATVSLTYEIE